MALDKGAKTVCAKIVLFAKPRADDTLAVKFGVVASRKVGGAVVRNRVKRRLREAFRHIRTDLEAMEALRGVDLVVVARPSAADTPAREMAGAIRSCVQKLTKQLEAGTA